MTRKNKQLLFILSCLVILIISSILVYKYIQYQESYSKIHLTFKQTDDAYEINTQLEAISFIKDTNAQDIVYPNIDTSKIGEHTYIYIAEDSEGNKREFILVLNIVDSIKPIISLNTGRIIVVEGFEDIDFKSYLKESYDAIEGKIEPKINIPNNFKEVGTHKITYTATDSNNNSSSTVLTLIVNKKETEQKKENENTNNQQNSNSGTNQTNPGNSQTKPSSKPLNQKYLFTQGYNMKTAVTICSSKLSEAKKSGYSGGCFPLYDDNGLTIGMELKID